MRSCIWIVYFEAANYLYLKTQRLHQITLLRPTTEHLLGYVLKSLTEVQDINIGNIITIGEAQRRDIIKNGSGSLSITW